MTYSLRSFGAPIILILIAVASGSWNLIVTATWNTIEMLFTSNFYINFFFFLTLSLNRVHLPIHSQIYQDPSILNPLRSTLFLTYNLDDFL